MEDSFSSDSWEGWFLEDSSELPIYCAAYFYYCYISATSDHEPLDSGGWDPCSKWWPGGSLDADASGERTHRVDDFRGFQVLGAA